jgi:chemotaxis protein CheC
MDIKLNSLNTIHLDALKEIGNIGAGNAATSLAKLLSSKVDMQVPQVKILEFSEVSDILGGAETEVVGILLGMEGDLEGIIMFLLEQKSAHLLVNMLMGRDINSFEEFSEIDISALQEIGNILTGAYLSSLSTLTNLNIYPTVPQLAIDMAGAILSVPAIEFGKTGDNVLFIETEFIQTNKKVLGDIFMIPDVNSFDKMMKSLGVV